MRDFFFEELSLSNFFRLFISELFSTNIYKKYICLKKLQEDGFWSVVGNVVVGDRASNFGE